MDKNGKTVYYNGDPTETPSVSPTKCNCGHKHYWDGIEYDNLPELLDINVSTESKELRIQVCIVNVCFVA